MNRACVIFCINPFVGQGFEQCQVIRGLGSKLLRASLKSKVGMTDVCNVECIP